MLRLQLGLHLALISWTELQFMEMEGPHKGDETRVCGGGVWCKSVCHVEDS